MEDTNVCMQNASTLRNKLRAIEAKRRYPKTPDGRKKYVQESLDCSNVTPWYIEAVICLIISPVILGCLLYALYKLMYQKFISHES